MNFSHASLIISLLKEGHHFYFNDDEVASYEDGRFVLRSNTITGEPEATRLCGYITDSYAAPKGTFEGNNIRLVKQTPSKASFYVQLVDKGFEGRIIRNRSVGLKVRHLRRSTRVSTSASTRRSEPQLPVNIIEEVTEEEILALLRSAYTPPQQLSAIKIQSVARGIKARLGFAVQHEAMLADKRNKAEAATKIQVVVRDTQARRAIQFQRTAATDIQRIWRGAKGAAETSTKRKASIVDEPMCPPASKKTHDPKLLMPMSSVDEDGMAPVSKMTKESKTQPQECNDLPIESNDNDGWVKFVADTDPAEDIPPSVQPCPDNQSGGSSQPNNIQVSVTKRRKRKAAELDNDTGLPVTGVLRKNCTSDKPRRKRLRWNKRLPAYTESRLIRSEFEDICDKLPCSTARHLLRKICHSMVQEDIDEFKNRVKSLDVYYMFYFNIAGRLHRCEEEMRRVRRMS